MAMRDILGIAVAVVIALLSQIVQPWSRPWWAGMISAGLIAVLAAGDLIWSEAPFFSSVPIPSPPSTNDQAQEVMLEVAPDELMDLYEGRTAIQADKLAEFYIGKLIPIFGPLRQVAGPTWGPTDRTQRIVVTLNIFNSKHPLRMISMLFTLKWKDRLEVIPKNKTVSAICKIVSIGLLDLQLDNCELRN